MSGGETETLFADGLTEGLINKDYATYQKLVAALAAADFMPPDSRAVSTYALRGEKLLDDVLRQEWKRAARDGSCLSLLFCDIDHFKRFNDTYGHQAGDDCLVRVAQAMEETLNRPADLAARYGGEEFVGLLVDTDAEGARLLAERVRVRVEGLEIEHAPSDVAAVLTVSLGAAALVPAASAEVENQPRMAHTQANARRCALLVQSMPLLSMDILVASHHTPRAAFMSRKSMNSFQFFQGVPFGNSCMGWGTTSGKS